MAKRSARSKVVDSVWRSGPLLRRETFEGATRLLCEVPLIGRLDLRETVQRALPPDRHAGRYEVHFMRKGCMEMWIDARHHAHIVRGGMAILTKPGQLHGGVQGLIKPARFCWLQFRVPSRPDQPMPGLSVRQTHGMLKPLAKALSPVFKYSRAFENCFDHLFEEHRQRRPDSVVMARCILHEFILWLGRDYQAGQVQPSPVVEGLSLPIRNAIRWLSLHLREEASVVQMAEAAGISERRFRGCFLREVGFAPADYVTRKLVERAQVLLQESSRSIMDIALELGFNSPSYFAAVFRKHTGQTPTEHRDRR